MKSCIKSNSDNSQRKQNNYYRTMKIIFVVILVSLFLAACTNASKTISNESLSGDAAHASQDTEENTMDPKKNISDSSAEASDEMKAFVCGAVNSPGVVDVKPKDRIIDVIERAGGFSDEADTDYLNLAATVNDADRIYVPTVSEVEEYTSSGGGKIPDYAADENPGAYDKASGGSCVNINSADKNELMTLPGIGEAKAKKIIDYRNENGSYKSIDEIKNITGIKDGIFESIKDLICI